MDESNGKLELQETEVKEKKKLSGKKKALIIVGSVVLVLILAVVGVVVFMLSGLNRDTEISKMDPAELGAAPGTTTIVRGSTTETDEILSSDRVIANGDYEHVELPEEVSLYMGGDGEEVVSTLLPGAEDIQVFAVFGTDLEDLSDCNMIVALDKVHNKIKVISIARDSYVYYSDLGISSKINHAYNWGGPAMSIKVLNENYYLNVEDYVAVNWDQMQNIVNYLHGVWVYLDYDEWVAIGSPERYEYDKYVKLYGLHARKYAGLRSIDSDFQRMSRQQEVLTSMYNIGRNLKLSKYPGLIYYCLNMCTTSFGYSELLDMSTIMLEEDLEIEFYTFPPDDDTYAWGGFIDDVFYFVYDTDKASDEIYKIIYEELYVSGYDNEEDEAEEEPVAESAKPAASAKPATSPKPAASAKPDTAASPTPETSAEPEPSEQTTATPVEPSDPLDALLPAEPEPDTGEEEQQPTDTEESSDPLDALIPEGEMPSDGTTDAQDPTAGEEDETEASQQPSDPMDALIPSEESDENSGESGDSAQESSPGAILDF